MDEETTVSNGDTCTPTRLLTPDDYLEAAKIVAKCEKDRLPLILRMLEKGGWEIEALPQNPMGSADTSDISARIKATRLVTGLRLAELGEYTGLSTEVLRIYEDGRRFPRPERYMRLVPMLDKLIEKSKEGKK